MSDETAGILFLLAVVLWVGFICNRMYRVMRPQTAKQPTDKPGGPAK